MATSQNGYAGHKSPKYLRKWKIPGTDRHFLLRNDYTGFVLACFAYEYAQTVEKPSKKWDWWGWAYRAVRGFLKLSNHASATAVDINAVQHPLGTLPSRNFSSAEIKRIKALLGAARYNATLRWGGLYKGRKDGMHYEINRPYAAVTIAAKRLAATAAGKAVLAANPGGFTALRKIAKPAPAKPKPTPAKPPAKTPAKPAAKLPEVSLSVVQRQALSGGKDKRPGVVRVQRALIARGYLAARNDDGYYGKKTKAAYKRFQKKLGYRGKDADGIPGKVSLQKLGASRFRAVK